MNKIAAAVLLAGIIAMVSGIASEAIYYGGLGHGHEEEKRGYSIAVPEVAEGGAIVAAVEEAPVDIAPFLAQADLAAGEKLIKRCTTCHTFEKGGRDGVGPNQWGLVGGAIAHSSTYPYSEALKSKHGETWTFQALSDFLANPKKYIPGNKMAYAGLKKPQDRANLIAYLNTLSDNPKPLPK